MKKDKILVLVALMVFSIVTLVVSYAIYSSPANNDHAESFQRITGAGLDLVYSGNKLTATGLLPSQSKSDTFTVKYNSSSNPSKDPDGYYMLYYIVDENELPAKGKAKNLPIKDQLYVYITETTTGGKGTDNIPIANVWKNAALHSSKNAVGFDVTSFMPNGKGSKTIPILENKATISSGATHTYNLKVTFADSHTPQAAFLNSNYQAHIEIETVSDEFEQYVNFSTDSWDKIAGNANIGNTSKYKIGDVKCVQLDGFTHSGDNGNGCTASNEFAVRIVNKDACPAGLDSESACGFVLEFADIIINHNMNPAGELNGTQYDLGWNIGGWPASSMYSYINEVEGNSSSGTIFKALPSDLQEIIISTHVVSGHGSGDSNSKRQDGNWESDDLLYLLSPVEVYGNNPAPKGTTDNAVSRQLKYYAGGYELNGGETSQITTSNYGSSNKNAPIKKIRGSTYSWWMRSADSTNNYTFRSVRNNGDSANYGAYNSNGVAPAFRLNTPDETNYFGEDSWTTIATNVRNGTVDDYKIGDIKCVPLTGFTHTGDNGNGCTASNEFAVRIANKDACPEGLDSESACGFVLEFADIITIHNMNPNGELNGTQYDLGWNIGGWPVSSMYSYLNEVDGNSSSGTIFKALPSDLQEVIITTHVVSGHGSGDSNSKRQDGNWESDDLLYLLSPVEVYGNNPAPTRTSDNAVSRQLKYYAGGYELNGEETSQITTRNYESSNKNTPIKKKDGSVRYWWMRSANSFDNYNFHNVYDSGNYAVTNANGSNGVAPAFRIG